MTITILVIDSQDMIAPLVKILNALPEYDVIGVAQSRQESLTILKEHEIDVVLFLIHDSEKDWPTTCEAITSNYLSPVIILAVYGTNEDIKQAILAGAKHFLVSPFDVNEVLATIQQVTST